MHRAHKNKKVFAIYLNYLFAMQGKGIKSAGTSPSPLVAEPPLLDKEGVFNV
jgi:hypothetical protein